MKELDRISYEILIMYIMTLEFDIDFDVLINLDNDIYESMYEVMIEKINKKEEEYRKLLKEGK